MNRQQFLTELRAMLSFMSDDDRDLTICSFDTLFERAGEAGEAELLTQLGTPTKAAVEISRRYQSEGLEKALAPFGEIEIAAPAPQQSSETVPFAEFTDSDDPMQQLAQEVFSDIPAYELAEPENMELVPEETPADADDLFAALDRPEAADSEATTQEAPAPQPDELAAAEAPLEMPAETPAPKPAVQPVAEPWRTDKREKSVSAEKAPLTGAVVPRVLGIPMFLFIMIVLGIPLAMLFITAMIVLLAPGAAGIGCAYLSAVACLWSINYVADTILLIGLALVLLAVGVIVLFGGIWLDIQLFIVYKQAVGWLAGALIGRRLKQ